VPANWSRTIHGIGDLHAGGVELKRVSALLDDAKKLKKPALHLQIGDATQHGLPEEDVLARKWLRRLPARHHTILGNHDVMDDKRTPGQWAQAYGYASPNHVIDELPFVRIICVAPDRDGKGEQSGTLSDATLAWMSTQLESAGRDCWIACHWPLKKTVMGNPDTHYTSDMGSFYAKPDDKVRALLASHPNAKAWLSGHTHSPIRAPGLVTRAPLAPNRSILAVNLSAIVFTGNKRHTQDPVRSIYLTHRPGEIEVRFRDHVKRQWMAVGGKRVVTVKV
jgi:3',5'-cyclic AMP phosphodiesterase CpdA